MDFQILKCDFQTLLYKNYDISKLGHEQKNPDATKNQKIISKLDNDQAWLSLDPKPTIIDNRNVDKTQPKCQQAVVKIKILGDRKIGGRRPKKFY